MPGTLIILWAAASCTCCGHELAEATTYLVIRSPLQDRINNPVRLVRGFDPMACGLRVWFWYGGEWRVGVLLRDGRVLSDNVIYEVEKW